ncbi:hypothetical protein [Prosthecobacter sp.]
MCHVLSLTLILLTLLSAAFQLLAFSNFNFGRISHLALFLAGWGIVLTCGWLAFRMITPPAWYRLKLLGVALPLQALLYWLYSLPSAAGLFH